MVFVWLMYGRRDVKVWCFTVERAVRSLAVVISIKTFESDDGENISQNYCFRLASSVPEKS